MNTTALCKVEFTTERWEELINTLRSLPDGTELFLCPTIPEGYALTPEPAPIFEVKEWVPLSESNWINLVNHKQVYAEYNKVDAVNLAVKLTEEKLS